MIHDFLLALGYFTRIPVPAHPNFSTEALKRSAFYFPVVGSVVGILLAGVYSVASFLWPPLIAVLLTMSVGFLVTGGFHEDGWADTADGLGGAFEREKKLNIMTDSRLGTYGSLALWANLSLKAVTLSMLLPTVGWVAWLFLHTTSRWVAMASMVFLPYAKLGDSKAKPVVQAFSWQRWLLSGAICFIPMIWLNPFHLLVMSLCLITGGLVWLAFIKKQLQGYTGDTLGAHQQLSELLIILSWLALI